METKIIKQMIGNKLKKIRKERGYTQESIVAALLDSNEQDNVLPQDGKGWQSYEVGRTSPSVVGIAQIAKFFGVSTDYILGLSEEEQPQAKEFQKATGLSESAISNISRYKDCPEMISCINQFLSSAEFIEAIARIVFVKSPVSSFRDKTEDMKQAILQGSKLYNIATGQKKRDGSEAIKLTGKELNTWELWQVTQDLNKLIDRIVKGDNEDGKC